MASLDVGEAFLKGLTFEEVQQMKGGPKREVCMILPRATSTQPSGAAILRQITGFEDFNEAGDALEMLKGGFGLADAPNLFTSRVDQVFRTEGLLPTLSERKVYVKHKPRLGSQSEEHKNLVLIVSAHMDDFKAAGTTEELE